MMEEQKKRGMTEEEKKKIQKWIEEEIANNNDGIRMGGIEPRRSGCMLVLIIPLIISITMACLVIFK